MGNPLGVHALVWTGDWTPADAEHAISSTKAAGYDLIEIAALEPSKFNVEDTRSRLDAHGLEVSYSLGLSPSSDINSDDLESVRKGRDVLFEALTLAHGTGAQHLCGVLYGALAKYPGPATTSARRNSSTVIKELAQAAQPLGIQLSLEFVNRYESNLLNTVAQTLEFIDEVGEDNVKVHADVYHMNIEENGFREPLMLAGDRLGYVHIGESHRGYLGTGTIDFPQIFEALVDIDYSGPITFESFSSAVVDQNLSNALAVWRNLWSDGMDLATSAREFITDGLAAARTR